MKKVYLVLIFIVVFCEIQAQKKPFVKDIYPNSANVNKKVTISGSGFSSNPNEMKVFFGAHSAIINTSTENFIEVTTTTGITHDYVNVINTATGFSSSSNRKFFVSYSGLSFDTLKNADVIKKFTTIKDTITGEYFINNLCACDFNNDGLVDIVATSNISNLNSNSSSRIIFQNGSTLSSIRFSNIIKMGKLPTNYTNCKDIDGDGFQDLVVTRKRGVTEEESMIEVYLNNSNKEGGPISFSDVILITPPKSLDGEFKNSTKIRIEDLNIDGRKDLIISNDSDKTIDIYLNIGSKRNIKFDNPFQLFLLDDKHKANGLKVVDINNDHLLDVVVIPLNENYFVIYENNSSSSELKFREPLHININDNVQFKNIETGDFDNDGKEDIIIIGENISTTGFAYIFKNISTESIIKFDEPISYPITINPWYASMGDLDGDGDLDIAIAVPNRLTNNIGSHVIDLLINKTDNEGIKFSLVSVPTNYNSRYIQIVDLNNDSKPDIVTTSNSLTKEIGYLTTIKNDNCIIPEITPVNGIFCNANPFIIEVQKAEKVKYIWINNDRDTIKQNNEHFLDISTFTEDLKIKVVIKSDDGLCTNTSLISEYKSASPPPPTPTIITEEIVCSNQLISLKTDDQADNYFWQGPNDFTSNEKYPTISNATSINSGVYSLKVSQNGGCESQSATKNINVKETPLNKLNTKGIKTDFICNNSNYILSVNNLDGYTYQWFKDVNTAPIEGATSSTYTATTKGTYFVQITDIENNNCIDYSDSLTLNKITFPDIQIALKDKICKDKIFTINVNDETLIPNSEYSYLWEVKDSENNLLTQSTKNKIDTIIINSLQNISINFTLTSKIIPTCNNIYTKNIQTVAPKSPLPEIKATSLEKCFHDSVKLTFQSGMILYEWSTGSNDSVIYAKNNLSEMNKKYIIKAEDSFNCIYRDTVSIINYPLDMINISSDEIEINNKTIQFPAHKGSIELRANGGSEYKWYGGNAKLLSEGDKYLYISKDSLEKIWLEGKDEKFNCISTDTIKIKNKEVYGRKSFSPNGDGLGFECWEILNASKLSDQCTVYIFDSRGINVISPKTAPFDSNCIWNGNNDNGESLPMGIYYFVLKCNNDGNLNQSGTIILAR